MDTFAQLSTYLTESEQDVLAQCENIIERGLKSFIEVGTALQAIRDNRLYREAFPTFEGYCQDKWGMTRRNANYLIDAVEVVDSLGTIVPKPENEAQARPLSRVEPDIRPELWQSAIDTAPNGKVTAAHVGKVVDEYQEKERGKSTVTYLNQPAIHATRGTVPLAGNSHVYTVNKLLWPEAIEDLLQSLLVGHSLHMCCGFSTLGDVRLDIDEKHNPDLLLDAAHTGLDDKCFDTVLCDPPYNGEFQWNHDLLTEIARLSRKRIIFQHWFIPADPGGRYKKANVFQLSNIYVWQPQTYFGRAQLISVFDSE